MASQENLDALADAETLRLFAEAAWEEETYEGGAWDYTPALPLALWEADLRRGGRMMRHVRKGRTPIGMIHSAAHAAFLAVPGLREE